MPGAGADSQARGVASAVPTEFANYILSIMDRENAVVASVLNGGNSQ